jgi:hypothetical protein
MPYVTTVVPRDLVPRIRSLSLELDDGTMIEVPGTAIRMTEIDRIMSPEELQQVLVSVLFKAESSEFGLELEPASE